METFWSYWRSQNQPKVTITSYDRFWLKITKDDVERSLNGKDALPIYITIMSKGNAYANIQTEQYPKGVIRDQIASSETGATSNETLTPNGNATNATTTTNPSGTTTSNATNATTTTNETTVP